MDYLFKKSSISNLLIFIFLITQLFILIKSIEAKSLKGCCSHHGGVASCDEISGSVICNDGTTSPTCSCGNTIFNSSDNYNSNNPKLDNNQTYSSSLNNYNNNETKYRQPYKNKDNNEEYKKVTWFLLTFRAGMEQYYYKSNNTPEDTAFSEIKSKTEAINLYYYEINASIPLLFFKSIYKRKWSENGSVNDDEKNEYIEENIDNPKKQFFLSILGGFIGFEVGYLRQNFDIGTFKYYKSSEIPDDYNIEFERDRNILDGESYYTTYKQQIDFKYHFNWTEIPQYGGFKQSEHGADFFIGYRYLEYKSPAIIYTLDNELIVGESLPQILTQYIHLIGFGINNNNKPLTSGLNLIFGLEFYAGYGYSYCNLNDYWFLPSLFPSDYNSEIDKNTKINFISTELGANIGIIYCLTNSYLITSIKLEYAFDTYLNIAFNTGDYNYETSEFPIDYFHSIKFSAELTF